MPKLHALCIFTEIVVYADSPEEAVKLVQKDLHRIVSDETFEVDYDCEMTAIPGGWDDGCIPYGDVGDRTLGELMKPPEDPTNGGITPILPGLEVGE